MKAIVSAVLLAAGFVGLSGCASQLEPGTSQKFTEAEKAVMTEEEKLAIYNANAQVREEDRVTCTIERQTGSHMTRRICGSTAERRTERAAGEEALRKLRDMPIETITGQ